MSLPTFPATTGLTRENAINQILSSIAMEELAISHILNAEGEKIQYALGTLEGASPPEPPTIEQVLQVNDSVKSMLEASMNNQMVLNNKMDAALSATTLVGPPGPPGPPGQAGSGAIITFSAAMQNLQSPSTFTPTPGQYGFGALACANLNSSSLAGFNIGDSITYDPTVSSVALQIASANIMMPRDGIINGFMAEAYSHSNLSGQPTTDLTMATTIYISKDEGETYQPALATPVDFAPTVTSSVIPMTSFQAIGSSGINIPVSKGDRIMFVMALRVNTETGTGSIITQLVNFSIAIS